MEEKQAEKEMDYRIGKIVLATMLSEGEYVASVGHPESLRLDSCGGENGQSRRFGWTLTAVCA